MSTLRRALPLLLIWLATTACIAVPTATPSEPALPEPAPVEIAIVSPGSHQTLTPEDARFAQIARDFAPLLDTITAQARTYFPPDRFAAEVQPLPHLLLRYAEDTDFSGQGIEWRASELIVVALSGEIMLLARAADSEDWSVYLPDDPASLQAFLDETTP